MLYMRELHQGVWHKEGLLLIKLDNNTIIFLVHSVILFYNAN